MGLYKVSGLLSKKLYIFNFIIFLNLLIFAAPIKSEDYKETVHYLQHGDTFEFKPLRYKNIDRFHIYCYEGKPKNVINMWQSVVLNIYTVDDNYMQYDGCTPEDVRREFQEHRSSWSLNLFSWKQKQLKLNPFNQSCIGIDSSSEYKIELFIIRIDYWKVLFLLVGILLFLSAERLSSNTLFYYLCGISIGIATSFLILIYFISKLFPKKPIMYGVAAAGWSVGIYVLQLFWENIRVILLHYKIYLVWYAVGTGLISFIICYRWGVVENEKTKNIIRWSLQLSGFAFIFFSSQFQEAAMGQIVLLLLAYNFPKSWLSKSKTLWKRKFPPKVKLLSNDQYYEQGVRETSKALEELRQYCSSPKCNQWKTALKLKDVKRFASFIEGNSHLSDEEILEYETSIQQSDLTDDEENLYTDED